MKVNIDFIAANGQGVGEVARSLQSAGRLDTNMLRPWINPKDGRTYISVHTGGSASDPKNYKAVPVNNAGTLRRDEWKMLDQTVLQIAEERLNGVADLTGRGLTYNIGNGMGTTVLEWHDISDALSADISMDAVARQQGDRPVYETHYTPVPIVHADYEINERVLQVSRNSGNPLDTTLAERATRKVTKTLENMLFTDTTYSFGGGTIYSYLNHPDRIQKSLDTNWDEFTDNSDGTIGEKILADIFDMKQKMIDNYHYGPWTIYIPTNYEVLMDKDYDTSGKSTQTIRERIMKIEGIESVKVVDTLPDDNVLMVEMRRETVRWVNGMGIRNIEWSTEGGMVHKYKVMTIQLPQIRSDHNGRTGLLHLA